MMSSMGRRMATKPLAGKLICSHRESGCRVDVESVNTVVNVQNIRIGDDSGGWSMIEIGLLSRCIIGA